MAKKRLLEYRRTPALLTNTGEPSRTSLEDELKVYGEEDADPLPQQLMQKYIAYARTFIHPTLSPDAKQVILFHPYFAD